MTRRVAVTGATGFVGGHALRALAAEGWRLRILARGHPRLDLTPDPAPDLPGLGEGVEVIPGFLGDPRALAALMRGADAVVHIAGAVKARDRAGFFAANAEGAEAVARAWRAEAPQAPCVHVSSLAARSPEVSAYAASKREGEARLRAAGVAEGLRVLRPCAVYGPGDPATLGLFRLARAPLLPRLNDAGARLCVVEVSDLAAAIAAALRPEAAPGVYEVSDPRTEGYSWAELTAALAGAERRPRTFRVPAPVLRLAGRAGDLGARCGLTPMLGSGKAREILHRDWSSDPARQLPPDLWRARIGLEAGFAAAAAWYRRAGWLRN